MQSIQRDKCANDTENQAVSSRKVIIGYLPIVIATSSTIYLIYTFLGNKVSRNRIGCWDNGAILVIPELLAVISLILLSSTPFFKRLPAKKRKNSIIFIISLIIVNLIAWELNNLFNCTG